MDWLTVIALFLCAVGIIIVLGVMMYETGYKDGHSDGVDKGRESGYIDGFHNGKTTGAMLDEKEAYDWFKEQDNE